MCSRREEKINVCFIFVQQSLKPKETDTREHGERETLFCSLSMKSTPSKLFVFIEIF